MLVTSGIQAPSLSCTQYADCRSSIIIEKKETVVSPPPQHLSFTQKHKLRVFFLIFSYRFKTSHHDCWQTNPLESFAANVVGTQTALNLRAFSSPPTLPLSHTRVSIQNQSWQMFFFWKKMLSLLLEWNHTLVCGQLSIRCHCNDRENGTLCHLASFLGVHITTYLRNESWQFDNPPPPPLARSPSLHDMKTLEAYDEVLWSGQTRCIKGATRRRF